MIRLNSFSANLGISSPWIRQHPSSRKRWSISTSLFTMEDACFINGNSQNKELKRILQLTLLQSTTSPCWLCLSWHSNPGPLQLAQEELWLKSWRPKITTWKLMTLTELINMLGIKDSNWSWWNSLPRRTLILENSSPCIRDGLTLKPSGPPCLTSTKRWKISSRQLTREPIQSCTSQWLPWINYKTESFISIEK